ncbi:hypothetical protein CAPTEDRAFT_187519 [Capitella teleta]|uniref:Uncharacterized protein n=1 Tax=Capitella teleta TaxID=283909 RepID=R7TW18_CAPTE|nr:hypothetical protein CAPTEDRAFT_187519 [Capitella teleta]|eukprot:ELT95190.1 hypothetical protein CAPTEDRAFT_187519 [Capitella teleta]
MVQPCRLQRAPPSIDPQARPETFSLFTRRGERNVAPLTKESEEKTRQYHSDVFNYVHERAREHADPEAHPQFDHIFSEVMAEDCLTERCHRIDPKEQFFSTYEMGDLSLNLTPKASSLIEQYEPSEKLRQLLDKPCERGEGCYYRDYFPHVGLPGHVALPAGVINFLHVLSLVSLESARALLRSLEKLLDTYIEKEKRFRVCIVCLLIDQSTNQFSAAAGANILNFTQRVERQTFLLNIDSANDLGFRTLDAPDYLNPVVNVHEGKSVQLWNLQLNEMYSIKRFKNENVWFCVAHNKNEN